MKQEFLEAGQIANTHGIKGELKLVPWADSPEFLCQFDTFYIDGAPVKVIKAKPHKTNVIATLEGVDDINAAIRLKGKTIHIRRDQAVLPEGRHFIADLLGLEVRDADSGEVLGNITQVLTPPCHEVYVIEQNGSSFMLPAVEEFLVETNMDEGYVRVHLIEGMRDV